MRSNVSRRSTGFEQHVDRRGWYWFALGAALLVLTLGPTAVPLARAQGQSSAESFPPETEAALQAILDKHLARNGAPGALVGVWIPGRGSFVHAQGIRDVATAEALRSDDVVRIGSITKTFVATLILRLVDDGLLSLDDSLEQFVPGLPNAREITIRQLLGMTSGVANFLEDPGFLAAYEADRLMPFSPQQGLAIARTKTPDFVPGTGFHYSETNYFLLGLVIEQVTGVSVGAALDQRIVQPLGLSHTHLPSTPSMPEPFARGYKPTPAVSLEDVTEQNPAITWTAGAMVSNLDDLRMWASALANGTLLSPEMQAERLSGTPIAGGEPLDAHYGLGILSLAGFLGHNGGIPGYSSIALYLPEADATIVVLVNASTLEGGPADFIFYDIGSLLFPERFAALRGRP